MGFVGAVKNGVFGCVFYLQTQKSPHIRRKANASEAYRAKIYRKPKDPLDLKRIG